jgi:hypothetical protein
LTNVQTLQIGKACGDDGISHQMLKSDINNDLSKLNEWAKLWLVDFNPKKTKALVISTSAVPHLDLRFNGEPVEIVKTHKHLGLTFASDGNWTNHIDNIVNAAFKQGNVLRKLKFTNVVSLRDLCLQDKGSHPVS